MAPRDVNATQLASGIATLPELVALEALQRAAEAEQRLGLGLQRPEFGVSLNVDRARGRAGRHRRFCAAAAPVSAGQGQTAAAAARIARLRLEQDTTRAAAAADLGAAVAAYRNQVEAVRVLEADALAAAGENEQLARRSYEAGQISLADWLLYRREFLETQREYLDRSCLCALTLVEIDTIAGVLR